MSGSNKHGLKRGAITIRGRNLNIAYAITDLDGGYFKMREIGEICDVSPTEDDLFPRCFNFMAKFKTPNGPEGEYISLFIPIPWGEDAFFDGSDDEIRAAGYDFVKKITNEMSVQ